MRKLLSLPASLAGRIAVVGTITICVAVALSTALAYRSARAEMMQLANATLQTNIGLLRSLLEAHGAPRVSEGRLHYGDEAMNGNFAVVDKVKAIAGGTATIFVGDVRIATNVQKADGTRAVGTSLPGARHMTACSSAARPSPAPSTSWARPIWRSTSRSSTPCGTRSSACCTWASGRTTS